MKSFTVSPEMAQAVADGRKLQTRRPLKPQPTLSDTGLTWVRPDGGSIFCDPEAASFAFSPHCPYGKPGDEVKIVGFEEVVPGVSIRQDFIRTLAEVRVEPFQTITPKDAAAEGCPYPYRDDDPCQDIRILQWFSDRWNECYADQPEYQSHENPYCWMLRWNK